MQQGEQAVENNPKAVLGSVLGAGLGVGIALLAHGGPGAVIGAGSAARCSAAPSATTSTTATKQMAAQAAQAAFDNNRTGQPSVWNNPDTGNSGSVTPTRTYQLATGQYCRQYEQTINIARNARADLRHRVSPARRQLADPELVTRRRAVTRISALLAAASLVLPALVARADPPAPAYDVRAAFDEADANKDGEIEIGEFYDRLVDTFYLGDVNKDGYLDHDRVRRRGRDLDETFATSTATKTGRSRRRSTSARGCRSSARPTRTTTASSRSTR